MDQQLKDILYTNMIYNNDPNCNRFCFIFGSFNESIQRTGAAPKMRKDQDIDIMCSGIEDYEAKQLLKKQFPKTDIDKTEVNVYHARIIDNTIYPVNCYWQSCNFYELFNRDKIKYKFDCDGESDVKGIDRKDFGAHLRNPDKTQFDDYINKGERIDGISTDYHYNGTIKKHYGEDNYNKVMNKADDGVYTLFDAMKARNWELNNECQELFGAFISISKKDMRVVSNRSLEGLKYSEFLKRCYDPPKDKN